MRLGIHSNLNICHPFYAHANYQFHRLAEHSCEGDNWVKTANGLAPALSPSAHCLRLRAAHSWVRLASTTGQQDVAILRLGTWMPLWRADKCLGVAGWVNPLHQPPPYFPMVSMLYGWKQKSFGGSLLNPLHQPPPYFPIVSMLYGWNQFSVKRTGVTGSLLGEACWTLCTQQPPYFLQPHALCNQLSVKETGTAVFCVEAGWNLYPTTPVISYHSMLYAISSQKTGTAVFFGKLIGLFAPNHPLFPYNSTVPLVHR
jgi:hypothetical protein